MTGCAKQHGLNVPQVPPSFFILRSRAQLEDDRRSLAHRLRGQIDRRALRGGRRVRGRNVDDLDFSVGETDLCFGFRACGLHAMQLELGLTEPLPVDLRLCRRRWW